jgi:hypothetical protein
MYLETSAKDDLNVHDIFVQLSTIFLIIFFLSHSHLAVGQRLPPPPEADSNVIKGTSAFNQPAPQASSSSCC